VVVRVREDEAGHRDVNHSYANILNNKLDPNEEQQTNLKKSN
jgi:ubiquinol oxidase